MRRIRFTPTSFDQRGVSLLEALITVLIFSIGILGNVALQAAKVKDTTDAQYRITASNLAQQRVGQMWADPNNLGAYVEAGTDVSDVLPNGARTTTQPGPNQVQVVVTWQQPGTTAAHSYTLNASVSP